MASEMLGSNPYEYAWWIPETLTTLIQKTYLMMSGSTKKPWMWKVDFRACDESRKSKLRAKVIVKQRPHLRTLSKSWTPRHVMAKVSWDASLGTHDVWAC